MHTEFPWNGVQVTGSLPSESVPGFLATYDIKTIRVDLADTAILPSGTAMPTGLAAELTGLLDSAAVSSASPDGTPVLQSAILWSVTWGSRPTVQRGIAVVKALTDVVGTHASSLGVSLFGYPTYAVTAAANLDPHASMTDYSAVTWSGGSDPRTEDHKLAHRWLESWSTSVLAGVRPTYTRRVLLPLFYAPMSLYEISLYHPNGPWVTNDAQVWYDAAFYPAGRDGAQIAQPFLYYNTFASELGHAPYTDACYFTANEQEGTVIGPDMLALAPQEPLPPDPNGFESIDPFMVSSLAATAFDGAVLLEWVPPDYFGTAPLKHYSVTTLETNGTPLSWTSTTPRLMAGGLTNEHTYTFLVSVVTDVGSSPAQLVSVAPSSVAEAPSEPAVPPTTQGPEVKPPDPLIYPQPWVMAFAPGQPFVPSNWMKVPVEEGAVV